MKYLYATLLLVLAVVWLAVFSSDNNLHVITCDVGQGDAILFTYKTTQVLIDGGPNNKVLDCLTKHLPFWDKTIEVVILTHPEADHYTGLIEVFKNYKINYFLANQVNNSTPSYSLLKSLVGGSNTQTVNPYTGFKMRVSLIYLDILSPSQNLVSNQSNEPSADISTKLGNFNTKTSLNTFSIIGLLTFGNFKALTLGDAPSKILDELVLAYPLENIDFLKIAHHGSKTSISEKLLNDYKPRVAIISVGRNNIYHLPNQEVLDMLKDKNIETLRTDEKGEIELITDGNKWWIK